MLLLSLPPLLLHAGVDLTCSMSVGDFSFDEIFAVEQYWATCLFWTSSLILAFVLVNIFIAIIMEAYNEVLSMNPDAADPSSFVSICIMQVSYSCARARAAG